MSPPESEREAPFLGEPFPDGDLRAETRGSVGGHVVGIGLFLVAFLLAAAGVRALTRPLATSVVTAKLEEIAGAETPYDVIFLGNSHVLREIDPEVFDARAAEAGHPLRSYNLGAQGMPFTELEFVTRRLLEDPALTPRWLVVDLTLQWTSDLDNFGSRRSIAWHDFAGTSRACARVLGAERGTKEKGRFLYGHLTDFAAWCTNKGKGLEYARWLAAGRPSAAEELVGHVRGHQPLSRELGDRFAQRHDRFLEATDAYHRDVRRLAADRIRFRPHPPEQAEDLRELVAGIEAAGVHAVFTMPPVVAPTVRFLEGRRSAQEATLFLFNDAARYPELYPVALRFDLSHLNGEGARVFSRRLAEAFCRHLDESGSD